MATSVRTLAVVCAALVIGGITPALAEWSHDPLANNLICDQPENQFGHQIVSDGAGGAVMVWQDLREGTSRVFAQRIDRNGDPLWTEDGIRVCTYDSQQSDPRLVADSNGGYFVVWEDYVSSPTNIYAQRLTGDGTLAWANSGKVICTASGYQENPRVASDGNGNLFVTWIDNRVSDYDIYAQKVDIGGTTQWASNGYGVSTVVGVQANAEIASDGEGGAFVTWEDWPSVDVWAQHMSSAGAPYWADGGVQISYSGDENRSPKIAYDEQGGALIAWQRIDDGVSFFQVQRLNPATGSALWGTVCPAGTDHESLHYTLLATGDGGAYVGWSDRADGDDKIHIQRLHSNGLALWTDGGLRAAPAMPPEAEQYRPRLTGDGSGGLAVCWEDFRQGGYYCSIYAQRFDALGHILWSDEGALVSLYSKVFCYPEPVNNGENDFIIGWNTTRGTTGDDIYAQLIDQSGRLGRPTPTITQVADFPNDQGGQVIVDWTASYLDSWEWTTVENYSVWARESEADNRCEISDPLAMLAECADIDADQASEMAGRLQLSGERIEELYRTGWTFVVEVPAMMEPEYSCVAFTFGDSTEAGIPWAEYRVVAHGEAPIEYWASDSESGYSVDNLAPGAPIDLAGEAASPTEAELEWLASGQDDEDLAFYTLYRGEESGFPLDEAHAVGTTTDLILIDPCGEGLWYYRVTALDVHGNESPGSNEVAVQVGFSAVDDAAAIPTRTVLHAIRPNPVMRSAAIAFDLAQPTDVQLSLWSVDGRQVATLASGAHPAGHHIVEWQGRDGQGHPLPHGVYFARLRAGDYTARQRMLVVQ